VTGHGTTVDRKISTPRGEHVSRLLYYLFVRTPGRNIQTHIVAGWRHPADLEPRWRPDGTRDFTKLAGLLLQTARAALGKRPMRGGVALLHARGTRRPISATTKWAAIAHEVLDRTGLAPYGQEDEAVRWSRSRHGDDHIHLVGDTGPPGRR